MTTEDELIELEQRRVHALATADADLLRTLFDPRATYCHATGRVEPIDEYIDAVATTTRYLEPQSRIETIVAEEDAAFVSGRFTATVAKGDATASMDSLFGITWFRVRGEWKIIAVRMTRPPS